MAPEIFSTLYEIRCFSWFSDRTGKTIFQMFITKFFLVEQKNFGNEKAYIIHFFYKTGHQHNIKSKNA